MLEIYLCQNTSRNKRLLAYCDTYGIDYTCKTVDQVSCEDLLSWFAKSSDCFELLASSFKRYRNQNQMTLSELVTMVLRQPDQHLRLPLVVSKKKVYPDVRLEELRTFLPRSHKEMLFRHHLVQGMLEEKTR